MNKSTDTVKNKLNILKVNELQNGQQIINKMIYVAKFHQNCIKQNRMSKAFQMKDKNNNKQRYQNSKNAIEYNSKRDGI